MYIWEHNLVISAALWKIETFNKNILNLHNSTEVHNWQKGYNFDTLEILFPWPLITYEMIQVQV